MKHEIRRREFLKLAAAAGLAASEATRPSPVADRDFVPSGAFGRMGWSEQRPVIRRCRTRKPSLGSEPGRG